MSTELTAGHGELSVEQISDRRQAASRMRGTQRRAFLAEMALKYCDGNARQAERVFRWNRKAVACGLGERRTGIKCLGAQAAFGGRPRWATLCTHLPSRHVL